VDYPAFCAAVGRAVVRGDAERGIVLGGSGQGEQVAANKVHGVRAALCNDLYTARMAREHNDANVISMGGRIVAPGLADEIVITFLQTPYQGGRHNRRVEQLGRIGELAADPGALDAYLDSLVPGITDRARGTTQGASS
jgi:ribose 5-phosphate isomerase B